MIYLASPYSDPDRTIREDRWIEACRYTAWCMRRGAIIFSPIVYGHPLAKNEGIGTDHQTWWGLNSTLMQNASELQVLCIDGWNRSLGVNNEIKFMKSRQKIISYVQWNKAENSYDISMTFHPYENN